MKSLFGSFKIELLIESMQYVQIKQQFVAKRCFSFTATILNLEHRTVTYYIPPTITLGFISSECIQPNYRSITQRFIQKKINYFL